MKKLLLLLILFLLPFTANSETVTTDNLLSNSTFGTGTTYDTTGWTVSSGTSGHGNTTIGGGNAPGGSVAATGNTNIEQTVSSIKTAAGMTVNEVRKGWSSTMSTDIWYWNSQNNTTTLKQTITDNDGNVTTQQRVITDTGCGGINCGQYSNYTDTHIQGSNTKDDFSIKVGVANSNSLSGHYGPDIDDIQLKITYTDVPPIEEDTQEELDEITEDIDDVVEDIEDNIVWEDNFTFEEEYAWEEDFYFEEDFNTDWETFDTTWEEYEIEFDDNMYFEMEEEFVEFETVMMPEDTFEDMYMEEFEEFEEFEDAWEMEPEMTEMDTFFNEMTEDDWQEFEEMSEDEFTEFIEEEFPEEFAEMQEEMEETPVEEEMVFEEEEVAMTEEPEEAMEEPEEMTEDEPTETEVASEESTEEATDDVETESEPEESTQEVTEDESKPDAKADEPSGKVSTAKLKEEKIKTKSVKIDVAKIKEIIVEEVKVDLFSNQEALQEYSQVTFYQPEQIYTDVDNSFFDQVNMLEYSKEIYQNVRLASYMDNDPVEVHRKNMERINMEKQRLLIELQQLRNQ